MEDVIFHIGDVGPDKNLGVQGCGEVTGKCMEGVQQGRGKGIVIKVGDHEGGIPAYEGGGGLPEKEGVGDVLVRVGVGRGHRAARVPQGA